MYCGMTEEEQTRVIEAINAFGCTRLAAVIHTIRHDMGIAVDMEMVAVENRFGEVCRVARYKLAA